MVAHMLIWGVVDAYLRVVGKSPRRGADFRCFFSSLVSCEIRLRRRNRGGIDGDSDAESMYDGRTSLPRLPLVRSFIH